MMGEGLRRVGISVLTGKSSTAGGEKTNKGAEDLSLHEGSQAVRRRSKGKTLEAEGG